MMEHGLTISVAMGTYNGETYLREQLESLFVAKDMGVTSVQEYLAQPYVHAHSHAE